MIDYFKIHDVFYSKSQFLIINVYALTVHKTQFLIFNNIVVNLNSTMFVQNHAYTTLNKISKFKNVNIITFCKEIFKMNSKTMKEYERLQKIYDDIIFKKR